jgi:hypothetical protein
LCAMKTRGRSLDIFVVRKFWVIGARHGVADQALGPRFSPRVGAIFI